jgi:hypothetical protein
MNLLAGSRHTSDEDLIRYMDHQLDRDALRRTAQHLRTCPECAGRLEELERASSSVSRLLGGLPVEMPDPNKRAVALAAMERARFRRSATGPIGTAWMRTAAGILLLLGLGFGTSPGRAWMAQAVVRIYGGEPSPIAARLVEWLGEGERLVDATPVPAPAKAASGEDSGGIGPLGASAAPVIMMETEPPTPPGSAPPVRFAPPGPDVELAFRSIQDGGSATLWIRDVSAANGQITSGLGGERLIPTADGLEVRNRRDSRADYVVTIPTRFRFVRVRVGDSPEVLIPISKSKREWIWTINLRTSALE